MIEPESALERLRAISKTCAFNCWLGLEVTAASVGRAELQLAWRSEFGQYSGFLHAGIMGALIDTACGFAAATITADVLASHNSVNFFRPAVALRFIARGKIVEAAFAGGNQVRAVYVDPEAIWLKSAAT